MPALCSALCRRSPLLFPGALFRASLVPSFVQNPHSSPRCVCTLPRTTLVLSALLLRRSPQRGPGARLPTATALFLRCDGAILSHCCWALSRSDSGILRAATALTFSHRRRSVSCCAGAIVLASPGQYLALPRCGKKDSAGQREE